MCISVRGLHLYNVRQREKRSNAQIHPSLRKPLHLTFNVVRQFVSPMRNNFSCVEGDDWGGVAIFG